MLEKIRNGLNLTQSKSHLRPLFFTGLAKDIEDPFDWVEGHFVLGSEIGVETPMRVFITLLPEPLDFQFGLGICCLA